MTTLAIDQGTTSTRGVLLEEDGTTSVVVLREHHQSYPAPGWVEHDPHELVANIRACIDGNEHVDAIGIDNQGESCLAWDADTKRAVSPVIVWQDDRTKSATERMKGEGVESEVMEKTGLPLDPYFSASKLAWIVDNVPEAGKLLRRGKLRLGTTDAFFLEHLTGRFVTDITTASRTSLMNLERGCWDETLCEHFRVPIEALPEIVSTTGDFGEVRTASRSIPLRASVVDQQASLFGHGCRTTGDAKVTFGTGAFALALTGAVSFRAPEQGLLPTIAWQLESQAPVFALDGGVYTASAAINWARTIRLFSDFEELNSFDGPTAIERGLVFVPALSGLACPHWDRNARGTWLGLSLDTTARDMVRAVIEGIALRAAEVLGAMGERVALSDTVSIDGGMSVNPYFCGFLSEVLQKKVSVPQVSEMTAYGTALLATPSASKILPRVHDCRHYYPTVHRNDYCDRFRDAISVCRTW